MGYVILIFFLLSRAGHDIAKVERPVTFRVRTVLNALADRFRNFTVRS